LPPYSFLKYRRLLDHPPLTDPFALRITALGEPRSGNSVVYWMQTARRTRANLALDYATRLAESLKLPLRITEDVADDAARAAVIVTDEYPIRQFQDRTKDVAATAPVHLVDGNGILPMRIFEKEQYSAKFLRDRAHRVIEQYFHPPADEPDDSEAHETLGRFIANGLHGYAEMRNKSLAHTSGLSPYLHRGEIGIAEVVREVLRSDATAEDIDAFLEEAIIRRELSFNLCFYREDHDSLSALPDWAKRTLDAHRNDRRKPQYTREELEHAATHDEVWNLSQRQLITCGTIHGYLRMLWGKKIIEWSATPEEAHATMIALHEKYAADAIDPNTHAGILWCFGKHDRPWAPERPIFGMIRYMSSDSAAKKVRLREIEAAIAQADLFISRSSRSPRSHFSKPRNVRNLR
jgi:deoxyribodipyrimidine photo-lyase